MRAAENQNSTRIFFQAEFDFFLMARAVGERSPAGACGARAAGRGERAAGEQLKGPPLRSGTGHQKGRTQLAGGPLGPASCDPPTAIRPPRQQSPTDRQGSLHVRWISIPRYFSFARFSTLSLQHFCSFSDVFSGFAWFI